MTKLNEVLHPVLENFQPEAILQIDIKNATDDLSWILAATSIAIFEECNNILVVDNSGKQLGIVNPSELEVLIAKQIAPPETRGNEGLPAMGPLSTIHPLVYVCPKNRKHPMYFFQSRPLHSPICTKDGVEYMLWQPS